VAETSKDQGVGKGAPGTARKAVSGPAGSRLALAVSIGLMMNSAAISAAVFNVSNTNDAGAGSLRQAVLDANASPGDDTITFDTGLGGIIALTSGQIEYTDNLTIQGPADGLIINAGSNSRIFAKPRSVPGRANLTLQDLGLTNGFNDQPFGTNCAADEGDGGAICTRDGNVTLINSIITNSRTDSDNSRGGAIFAYGTVTLENSAISENRTLGARSDGGGLNVGTLNMVNSVIINNRAEGDLARGGGIDAANVIMTGSTVLDNRVSGFSSTGGGFHTRTLTMDQSTVSGNTASGQSGSGGAFSLDGTNDSLIRNSTITENSATDGAGAFALGLNGTGAPSLELASSIVSANTGSDGNVDGSITISASDSLFGDSPGEISGTSLRNVFSDAPGLLPLSDNGCAVPAGFGVFSACPETHELRLGSPAIDAGANPLMLESDQRGAGFPRVIGAAIDIGALETEALAELRVTNSLDDGDGSLRRMVSIANSIAGPDTIRFAPGLSPIVLTSGQIDISDSLFIDGPVAGQVLDGNENSRIFGVTVSDATLELERLHLTNGATVGGIGNPLDCSTSTGEGGAICSLGPLGLRWVTISGSSTQGNFAKGGAVHADSDLDISDSVIENNSTFGDSASGGGVFATGVVTMVNSVIEGNSVASGVGGGLSLENAASISSSTIAFNTGGGIFITSPGVVGGLTLINSTVSGNTSFSGAGIRQLGDDLFLINSTITANQAIGFAAVRLERGSANGDEETFLELDSSILSGNFGPEGNLFIPDFDTGPIQTVNAGFSLFGDDPAEIDNGTGVVFDDVPQLLPLADNGCAMEAGAPGIERCAPTHLLSVTSPALDQGFNPLGLFTDQRGPGFARDIGTGVDIGAIEIDPDLLFRDGFEP